MLDESGKRREGRSEWGMQCAHIEGDSDDDSDSGGYPKIRCGDDPQCHGFGTQSKEMFDDSGKWREDSFAKGVPPNEYMEPDSDPEGCPANEESADPQDPTGGGDQGYSRRPFERGAAKAPLTRAMLFSKCPESHGPPRSRNDRELHKDETFGMYTKKTVAGHTTDRTKKRNRHARRTPSPPNSFESWFSEQSPEQPSWGHANGSIAIQSTDAIQQHRSPTPSPRLPQKRQKICQDAANVPPAASTPPAFAARSPSVPSFFTWEAYYEQLTSTTGSMPGQSSLHSWPSRDLFQRPNPEPNSSSILPQNFTNAATSQAAPAAGTTGQARPLYYIITPPAAASAYYTVIQQTPYSTNNFR